MAWKTIIFMTLLLNGCYSIDQQEGGVTGVVVDSKTGETLSNVKIARGYICDAPFEQLAVKQLSNSKGEFNFPGVHGLVFKMPFGGRQRSDRPSSYHYYFSKTGYRGVSVNVNPGRDQIITVRLAKHQSDQDSEADCEAENSAWTTFMKVNSVSLEVVSGLPAAVTAGAILIPVAVVAVPVIKIAKW